MLSYNVRMAVIHYYVVMPCHELRFSHSHIRLSQICDVSVGNNFISILLLKILKYHVTIIHQKLDEIMIFYIHKLQCKGLF